MADETKNIDFYNVNPEAGSAVEPVVTPKRGGSRKKKTETVSTTLEVSNSVYDQILEESRITNSLLKDLIETIVSISATNKEYNDKTINLLNEQIERQKLIIDQSITSPSQKVHSDIVSIDTRLKEAEKHISDISMIIHGIVKPKKKKKNKKF